MICGPFCRGRAPDWDRLQPGRRQHGHEGGARDTAQFAGPAASVLSDEPKAPGGKKENGDGMPMEMDTTDLIARARAGDHNAFRDLVQGHSHELQVHCHRILGFPAGRRGRAPADPRVGPLLLSVSPGAKQAGRQRSEVPSLELGVGKMAVSKPSLTIHHWTDPGF